MADNKQDMPLTPFRVLDLTEGGVNWAGRVLADLGADVIKVEPPTGSLTRLRWPFANDVVDTEHSLFWFAYCANKRSVTIDSNSTKGQKRFLELAASADILLESFSPGYMESLGLGYQTLRRINPRLVYTAVTPFGHDGPYAHYKATDLTLWSMGGATFLSGDADRAPARIAVHQAELHSGGQAAAGSMMALWRREETGRGQRVDISMQEVVAWTLFNAWVAPPMQHQNFVRGANVRGNAKITEECRDGYVNVGIAGGVTYGNTVANLLRWMAEEGYDVTSMQKRDWRAWETWDLERIGGPEFVEFEAARILIRKFLKTKKKAELFERSVRDGIMLAPCNTAKDIAENRHFEARDFWRLLSHPKLKQKVRCPGPWIKLSETPLQLRRCAPMLGEHNDEVFDSLPKKVKRSLPKQRAAPIAGAPFAGLRILDLSWVAVGPITTRYFADHGATVIRVESIARMDISRNIAPFKDGKPGINRSAFPGNWNANKLGLGVNLGKPKGRQLIERVLREWGPDVLVESFSPGTMADWGLDYANVRRFRPDIIYLSTSQLGQTGPHAKFKGYGVHASAIAGFDNLTGWPDRMPERPYGAYTDFVNPPHGVSAIIAALDYRRRTGKGQYIDQGQAECALHYLAPLLLDYNVNRRVAIRQGNADADYAPHGVYPCKEKETYLEGGSWVAIAVTTTEEWKALAQTIGRNDLAEEASLASAAGRKAREQELDDAIAAWTKARDRHQAMRVLQAASVPAGAVQKASDLWEDPQLAHRNYFQWLQHPECGQMPYVATQFTLSETPGTVLSTGPMIGQHNSMILGDFLGMTADEISELVAEGVVDAS